MIGILISVTGSIEGLPVSVEYLSSTRSYMKSKSIYLSIFVKDGLVEQVHLLIPSVFVSFYLQGYFLLSWRYSP